MPSVSNEVFEIDVIVVKGLGIEPPLVLQGIRGGWITSLCERGVDEDEGDME